MQVLSHAAAPAATDTVEIFSADRMRQTYKVYPRFFSSFHVKVFNCLLCHFEMIRRINFGRSVLGSLDFNLHAHIRFIALVI